MRRWVIGFVLARAVCGQTQVDLRNQSKNVDFSESAETRTMKVGVTLPGSCAAGDLFFKSDAPAGQNLYGCVSANTWMLESGGGASGGLTVMNDGTTVGTRSAANFIAGTGIMETISDTGAQINIQHNIDTAVIQSLANAQAGTALYCASASGSGSNYTCALNPTLTAYNPGMILRWRPDVNGAGGATTLNIDTLGTRGVTQADGVSNPEAGSISAGWLYDLWYDGTNFRILAPALVRTELQRIPAGCQGGTGSARDWSLPNLAAPALVCSGTAANNPTMEYPAASASEAYTRMVLPAGLTGAVDFKVQYAGTSNGNVEIEVAKQCFDDGSGPASTDYTFANAETQTVAIADNLRHFLSFSALMLPANCTAGAELVLRLKRVTGIANESTGALQIYNSTFTLRHK